MDFRSVSVLDLLLTYEAVDDELLRRNIQGKRGEPVGGYTQRLVCLALGLQPASHNQKDFDATDGVPPDRCIRYQIKGRRIIKNSDSLLGSIGRGQQAVPPFDFLVGVAYGRGFHVQRAVKIEYKHLWNLKELKNTNNKQRWQLNLTNGVLGQEGVEDIAHLLIPHRESVS